MTSALLVQTRKEVRALLPWTIGVAITCVALAVMAQRNASLPGYRLDYAVFFIMTYAFGVLAVAALSVGQEISHGTMPLLLVQPIDRLRILGLKLLVLTIALVGIGVVANAGFPQAYVSNDAVPRPLIVWGPVVAGIGLVPLLTILTRRPLGGVVFAVTIPGVVLAISERLYPFHDGSQAWTITWYGTLVASTLGLLALLIQFRRLEVAGDGRERTRASAVSGIGDLTLVAYHPTVRRPWLWLVVKKELRLQQMTLAVSGLYLLGAVGVMIVSHDNPRYVGPTFGTLSLFHAYFIPIIAGSVASAEERNMGTLAGQLLQPRNLRLQWVIKIVLTIGLPVGLAFGLPSLLLSIHRPIDAGHLESDLMFGVAMLAAAAVYVSSISSNSLWALLGSFPAIGAAIMIGGLGFSFLRSTVFAWFPNPPFGTTAIGILSKGGYDAFVSVRQTHFQAVRDAMRSVNVIEFSLIVTFGLLILYFAGRNHRRLDRNPKTIAGQALVLLLFSAAGTTAYLVTMKVAWRWLGY